MRKFDEAIEYARDAVRRRPDYPDGVIALAASLGYEGRAEEARAAIKEHENSIPSYIEQHPIYAPELKECLLNGLRKAGLLE